MDQRGTHVLLGDVALLPGVVLLLLPVLLLQQLGQCLQGLGTPQRGPLSVAGIVLNEVNALALHLHLEEERGRQQTQSLKGLFKDPKLTPCPQSQKDRKNQA